MKLLLTLQMISWLRTATAQDCTVNTVDLDCIKLRQPSKLSKTFLEIRKDSVGESDIAKANRALSAIAEAYLTAAITAFANYFATQVNGSFQYNSARIFETRSGSGNSL